MYSATFEAWTDAPCATAALDWDATRCRASWREGVPLLGAAPPALEVGDIEGVLGRVLELVGGVRPDAAMALGRFAAAWDEGAITAANLLPGRGRIGTFDEALGLDIDVQGYLATACLRPPLEAYFAGCRAHLGDHDWTLGVCPFCGGPPGFADIVEGGQRRLSCHLCGAAWVFSRLRCPFCGTDATRDLGRLEPEALGDQGYFLMTCRACRAYLKELDRRVRWNGGPPLVEDWGSPHLDLVAVRAGYWRPLVPLILGAGAMAH